MRDKKRIFIWGSFTQTAMHFDWLNRRYDIVGMAAGVNEFPKTFRGIEVHLQDENAKVPNDATVVVEDGKYSEKVCKILNDIGINDVDVVKMSDFLADETDEFMQETLKTQLEVIREILEAKDEDICDYKWLYKRVIRYGIYCFQGDWFDQNQSINWNPHGMMQIPEEFTDFCLSLLSVNVKSAMEIGVFRGRSSYFMCAILSRKNPELSYKLVDIVDRLDHYDEFYKLLPCLDKRIPSTSDEHKGDEYDFVFIDADHSYDESKRDWKNVGQYSSVMTGFHDIYAHEYDEENGGTVRTWKEICEETRGREHRIFSKYPDKWMGIGCVLK